MAKCEFCDKGVTFGIKVSHSHRRSNRTWKPNVKRVKAVVDGTPKHVYVCTRKKPLSADSGFFTVFFIFKDRNLPGK